jgi:protein-S-isoprenylcysteine O-methyltransferase Ste14
MKIERIGRWLFRRQGELQIPFVLGAIALLRPGYPFGSHVFDVLMDIAGFLFMAAGVGIRFWVIGYRKRGTSQRRGGKMRSSELITDGLYTHVRNPLYLGNLVIAAGVMILFFNPWLIPVFFCVVLHYYLIIRAEETYLEKRFGEAYLAYKQRTPRLIPAIWKSKHPPPDRQFDWNQVVKKEKDLVLAVILTPIVIEIYEELLHEGWRQFLTNQWGELAVYLTIVLTAFFMWLVVRYQKKRRHI